MRKGICIIVIMVVFLSIFISGCEEEVEDLCAQTEALPISVSVKPYMIYPFLNEKATITCVMNSIKCGEGGGDYVDEKIESSLGMRARFSEYTFNLNNRVDSVWVEGIGERPSSR